jgi:DNA-binding GntR family transcriptional regulator
MNAQEDAPLSDEDIHQRLVEAIIDQRLLPGTKLVEDKLGQAFGVSRTRIRQVLIRLAQEQVVTMLPNKGASVAQPNVKEAQEVFEARRVIEAALVGHFAGQAVQADLQALTANIEAEEAARQAGDHSAVLRRSGEFHLLLARATQHDTFERFLSKLVSRTSLILMTYAPEPAASAMAKGTSQRWIQACRCDEHRALVKALRAAMQAHRKPDAARRAATLADAQALMSEHLRHIEEGLNWPAAEQPAAPARQVGQDMLLAALAEPGSSPPTPEPPAKGPDGGKVRGSRVRAARQPDLA